MIVELKGEKSGTIIRELNCPGDNFSEECDCRGGLLIQKNTRILYSYLNTLIINSTV
jgi:hypothetical protein